MKTVQNRGFGTDLGSFIRKISKPHLDGGTAFQKPAETLLVVSAVSFAIRPTAIDTLVRVPGVLISRGNAKSWSWDAKCTFWSVMKDLRRRRHIFGGQIS